MNKLSCIISREIRNHFSLIVLLNLSITQYFSLFAVDWSERSFWTSLLQNFLPLSTHIVLGLRSFKILENAFATSCPAFRFKEIIQTNLENISLLSARILFHYCLWNTLACPLNLQPNVIDTVHVECPFKFCSDRFIEFLCKFVSKFYDICFAFIEASNPKLTLALMSYPTIVLLILSLYVGFNISLNSSRF